MANINAHKEQMERNMEQQRGLLGESPNPDFRDQVMRGMESNLKHGQMACPNSDMAGRAGGYSEMTNSKEL